MEQRSTRIALAAWTKREGTVFWALVGAVVLVSPFLGRSRREALTALGAFAAASLVGASSTILR